jgi:hypothetical protein
MRLELISEGAFYYFADETLAPEPQSSVFCQWVMFSVSGTSKIRLRQYYTYQDLKKGGLTVVGGRIDKNSILRLVS